MQLFSLGMRPAQIVLATLLFGCGAEAAFADALTLHGDVLEKGTRKPIFGAEVFVVGNDALTATSDVDGGFDLHLPATGDYVVGVVAVGYEQGMQVPVSVSAQEARVTIYLQANFTLPDIVVRAERNPTRVGKEVLTRDELHNVPGTNGDPVKAMQALPGIAVGTDVDSAPAIRGSRPEDNAYYVDNLPAGYLFHMGGIVSVLNADLVDSFNLHAAAFGPEYDNVTGAVIDVALRDPRTDRFGGKLNLSFIGADALVEGPLTDKQSLFISARRSYLDFIVSKVSEPDKGRTIEVPEYYDYQGKYVWRKDADNTFTVHMNGAADAVGFVLTDKAEAAQKQPDLIGHTSFNQAYHAQAATWDLRAADGASNKLALGHTRFANDQTVGTAGNASFTQDNYYLREQWRFMPAPAHALLVGGTLQSALVDLDLDIKNPRCTEFEADCDIATAPRLQLKDTLTVNVWSAYARDRWQVAPKWTLIGGLRLSHEDFLDETYAEPRVGVEWEAREGTLLTAGWGRYHQFPRGEQVVETFGNPNLHNIRAQHSVLGMEQRIAAAWSVKVEGYYKTFDDLVLADPLVNYRNGGSGYAYGLETLVKKDAQGPWSGWLSVSLAESHRRNDITGESFVFDYDQPVIATAVATYKYSATWTFGAKWTYHSGNPYTPIIGVGTYPDGRPQPLYGDVNSRRMPAYHRLDLRAERQYVHDTWKLNAYLDLINAYNQKNVAGYDYNATYTKRTTTYQLPLIPSFGVQAEF